MPLLALITRSWYLPRNLLLWGDRLHSTAHAVEYLIYVVALATFAEALSRYGLNTVVFFYGEFLFLIAAQINRVTMLAIKYSTCDRAYAVRLKRENVVEEEKR